MKKIEKLLIRKIGLISLFMFLFAFIMPVYSQPPPPPIGPPEAIPIEGGLIYLLAVGIGYGLQKIRQFRNKN